MTTLAGTVGVNGVADVTGNSARFEHPCRLAVDSDGNVFVVEDVKPIRRISPAGVVTAIGSYAGIPADGTSTTAVFREPQAITADASGNVTTVAGLLDSQGVLLGALPGSLNFPQAVVTVPSATGVKLLVVSEASLLSVTLP